MKDKPNGSKNKRKQRFKFLYSIFSLVLIFFLIYQLLNHIKQIQNGNSGSFTYIWVVLEIIGLLILPLISNPKRWEKVNKNREDKKIKKEEIQLNLKIRKEIELNTRYSPKLIVKCPKCGFENPKSTKKCFNCQSDIPF